jgi:ribosomal protein L15E
MKEKCIAHLEYLLFHCVNKEMYQRFYGAVLMAWNLDLITNEEKFEWIDKANKRLTQ